MIDAHLIFARGPGADAMLGVCLDQQNAVNEAARFRAMGRGALEQHCRKVAIAAIPDANTSALPPSSSLNACSNCVHVGLCSRP